MYAWFLLVMILKYTAFSFLNALADCSEYMQGLRYSLHVSDQWKPFYTNDIRSSAVGALVQLQRPHDRLAINLPLFALCIIWATRSILGCNLQFHRFTKHLTLCLAASMALLRTSLAWPPPRSGKLVSWSLMIAPFLVSSLASSPGLGTRLVSSPDPTTATGLPHFRLLIGRACMNIHITWVIATNDRTHCQCCCNGTMLTNIYWQQHFSSTVYSYNF